MPAQKNLLATRSFLQTGHAQIKYKGLPCLWCLHIRIPQKEDISLYAEGPPTQLHKDLRQLRGILVGERTKQNLYLYKL